MATKSEVAAQLLPSLGPKETAEKKLSTLSVNTRVTGSPSPLQRGNKTFRRLRRQPISPCWSVRWSEPLKHFGPREGAGGGGQGLHLGTPHASSRGGGCKGWSTWGMHLIQGRIGFAQILLELLDAPLRALAVPQPQRKDGPIDVGLGPAVDTEIREVREGVEL